MGTNYYTKMEPEQPCAECGHVPNVEEVHIGKSSGGWVFMFNQHPVVNMESAQSWYDFIKDNNYQIFDEYGRQFEISGLEDVVSNRSHPNGLKRPSDSEPDRWNRGAGNWDILKRYNEFC